MSDQDIVVVGGGQGSYSFLDSICRFGDFGRIVLVCGENELPYKRPPLSKNYLRGDFSRERLYFRDRSWYEERGIELRLGVRAERIDRVGKRLFLCGGEILSYDKLVLSTGSRARKLSEDLTRGVEGGLFYLRGVSDVDDIRAFLDDVFCGEVRDVLIVGGGYIGLEVGSVMRELGKRVVILESSVRILSRVACEETSRFFRELHCSRGVEILEGEEISSLDLDGEGMVRGVFLSSGVRISSDMMIVGIGVEACDGLGRDSGLECDRGIVVDGSCMTSDVDIYAIGDCAKIFFRGSLVGFESVYNASRQGEVVSDNLRGEKVSYVPVPWFWSDQYEVKLQIVGFLGGYDDVVVRDRVESGKRMCSHWYYRGDDLIALDSMGDMVSYVVGKKLIGLGLSIEKEKLLDLSFDLRDLKF